MLNFSSPRVESRDVNTCGMPNQESKLPDSSQPVGRLCLSAAPMKVSEGGIIIELTGPDRLGSRGTWRC